MKYYIPDSISKRTKATTILSNSSIGYTSNINDVGITNFLTDKNPDNTVQLNGINDLQQLVEDFF